MSIGYIGVGNTSKDVAFVVSSSVIETFDNMKVNKAVSYTTHKIHGKKAAPEMTGQDADTVTFEILLSAYLGVNPQKELEKLEAFMKDGTICNLVLGNKTVGTWVIKSIPYNVDYVYKEGDITQAKVTISLIEIDGNYGGEVVRKKVVVATQPAQTTTSTKTSSAQSAAAANNAARIARIQAQQAQIRKMQEENMKMKQQMQEQMQARMRALSTKR